MARRPLNPRILEKRLYQEAGSKCPVCGETQVSALRIHHIIPFARVGQHDPAAMILLCANCHARADRGEISCDELFEIKRRLQAAPRKKATSTSKRSAVDRSRRVSGAIAAGRDVNIGGDVVIKGHGQRHVGRTTVPGTVAEDKWKVGYLKYLGHRFNQFKEWEMRMHGQPMKHALIWVDYRREIKFNVEQTPLELFQRAVEYLRGRIDNTMVGRIRRSKGHQNYRALPQFVRLGQDEIDLSSS